MDKILVVDDSLINRSLLCDLLKDEYEIEEAENGKDALMILEKRYKEFSLVILDIVMPGISGYDVLAEMKNKGMLSAIPVIVMSGDSSEDVEKNSLALQATDFIRKPFESIIVKRRVKNVVDLYNYKKNLEAQVESQTKRIHSQYEKIRLQNEKIIEVLGMVVEYRDLESGNHIRRIKNYTNALACEVKELYPEYNLTNLTIDIMTQASVLHDVGKIAISDAILLKPARLSKEEFEIMKTHSIKGAEILGYVKNALDEKFAKIALEICRHHHERYDGRGYPDGLIGDNIPLSAQIVSVADVYDALVTERVYKKAYTHEEATNMILAGECGTFSPKMLEAFKHINDKFKEIAENNK